MLGIQWWALRLPGISVFSSSSSLVYMWASGPDVCEPDTTRFITRNDIGIVICRCGRCE